MAMAALLALAVAAPAGAADRTPDRRPAQPPRLTQGAAIAIAGALMLLAGLVVTGRRRDERVWSVRTALADGPAAPVESFPPAAGPPAEEARKPVSCQVRWECDGEVSWFAAVTTKARARGLVAESDDFEWSGADPPPRCEDAQVALRDLVDELQEAGWRPVRGRGRQDGAPRWYARRFLLTDEPPTVA
jgi:hypothetical protein